MTLRREEDTLSGEMRVAFMMKGVKTVVDERLEGEVNGAAVSLRGISPEYVQQGNSLNYLQDNFDLELTSDGSLKGKFWSEKGEGHALFQRRP